jgi:hypothetical protein
MSRRPLGKQGTRVANILQGYNVETSTSWIEIRKRFGNGITHRELFSIASIISSQFNISGLSRDARRSFVVLLKWFDDKWSWIDPILPLITQLDENQQPVIHNAHFVHVVTTDENLGFH